MRRRVLFDVNIILDVIENRRPHVEYSGPAIQFAADQAIEGFLCASSVDTLAILIRRNSSAAITYSILTDLLKILQIAPLNADIIRKALDMRWNDPEDAIVFQSACAIECSHIITRNVRDFQVRDAKILVLSPKEFLALQQ